MKLLGAGLIWTSLIYAGAVYFIKLKKRIVLLERTVLMIQEMRMQLEYLNLPVYELVNKIKSKGHLSELGFLYDCSELIEEGLDYPAAWKKSLENTVLYYTMTEKDKLLHLGLNLGTSNTENQINMLDMYSIYFNEYLSKAKVKEQKYASLTMTFAVLSGSIIFILII